MSIRDSRSGREEAARDGKKHKSGGGREGEKGEGTTTISLAKINHESKKQTTTTEICHFFLSCPVKFYLMVDTRSELDDVTGAMKGSSIW